MKNTIPSRSVIRETLSSMRANIPRAVRLVMKYTPGWTVANIIFVIILGLLPLATIYAMKLLVDTVTAGVQGNADTGSHLVLVLIFAAGIALATALFRAFSSYATEVQSVIMSDRVSDLIHSRSVSVDLAYYENPEYHDTLHLAQITWPSRPGKIINDLVRIGQNCISIAAIGALILSFSPIAGVVLIAAAIPAALLRVWYSQKTYALQLQQTEMERRSWYFHYILTHTQYAKEIRLFNTGSFFRNQ